MFKGLKKPLVFAHRGMSAFAPENTLIAFKMAFDVNADGIELDVLLSKDEEVVVFHEKTLGRITGLRDSIDQLSLEEIKSLDAGKHFSPAFIGEKIPALTEVFEMAPPGKFINIELKGKNPALVGCVLALIEEYNYQTQVILSSFNEKYLQKIKSLNPEIKIGLLALPSIAGLWHRKIINQYLKPDALHVFYRDVNVKMVEAAHTIGQVINCYTVNDPDDMNTLFSMDVDMIITDDPGLGIKQRDKF